MRGLPPFLAPRWLVFLLALCGCDDIGWPPWDCIIWPLWWAVVVCVIPRRDGEGGQ